MSRALTASLASIALALTVSCATAGDLAAEAEKGQGSTTVQPAPPIGACYRLTARDLANVVNDKTPVLCRGRHTSVTYAVARLPADSVGDATSTGENRVESAADRQCSQRFPAHVGGSRADRALTSLRTTYFLPDTEQLQAGARWVRCDLYAYAEDTRLATLPGTLRGALDNDRTRAALGICSTVPPDHRRFEHIICSRDHQWRAVSRVRLGEEQTRFPGPRVLSRRASTRCEGIVRSYLDTRDAFSFGFEVPQAASWRDGDRFGHCWARTSG